MAFPTGTGTVKSLDAVFTEMEAMSKNLKNTSQVIHDRASSGIMDGNQVIAYYNSLGDTRVKMENLIAGIPATEANAYGVERYALPGFSITAEYLAMRNALDTVIGWIEANADPATLFTFDTTENFVDWRVFTVGQTSGFRSVVNALIATID